MTIRRTVISNLRLFDALLRIGMLISAVSSVSEGRKASEKQKHSISLCTDGDLQDVQRLDSARRYRIAGIEFNAGGLFPLADAGLLHHRGVLSVNNRLIPLPDSPGLNNPNSQQAPERFVDADEAAAFLSISRKYLLKLSRLSAVPAHPVGIGSRKQWRYRISELEKWALCQNVIVSDNASGSPRAAKKGGK